MLSDWASHAEVCGIGVRATGRLGLPVLAPTRGIAALVLKTELRAGILLRFRIRPLG